MNRRLSSLALVVIASLVAGCDVDSTTTFQAQSLATSVDGTQALNSPIEVTFNAPIDPSSVSPEAVRVLGSDGRRLATSLRVRREALLIEAGDADGWPADTRLRVEIPHPWLGRPITSTTGRLNGAPFRKDVTTGHAFAPQSGPLRLTGGHELNGATEVTAEAEFWFEFDGVIDEASLDAGVKLWDLTHAEDAGPFEARVRPRRGISVIPFGRQIFRENTQYKLTLTSALRARDSRRLAADVAFTFATTASPSGQHTTDFRPAHLRDASLKPDAGPLKPIIGPPVPLTLTASDRDAVGAPFGREPSRVQILIPADSLGPEDALVTGLSFRVQGFDATLFESLSIRVGYAAPSHQDGLSETFDDNWSLPMPARGRELLNAHGRRCLVDPGREGLITFEFAEPFLYEAREARSVLVEVTNDGGIAASESLGFALLGERRDEPPSKARFVMSTRDWVRSGERTGFVPMMSVVVQREQPIELNPWSATSVRVPEYFFRPDRLDASGREFADFRIEFRAIRSPVDLNSADNQRQWTSDVRTLRGERTIQARVIFPLRPRTSGREDQHEVEIRRLTVPYREARIPR